MTEYKVANAGYSLDVIDSSKRSIESDNTSDNIYIEQSITRTFNFLAADVTTITRDRTYQSRGREAGGSAAVATTTVTRRFDDFQSDAEIRFMHKKLVELKGNPPPLDDIFKKGISKNISNLGELG